MKKLFLTLLCSLTFAAAAPAADFHESVNVIGRDISIVRAVTNTAAFSLATNYANSTVSYTPTGTWYYALQPTNSSGRLAAGAITSQTISATGRIVKLTWNKVAGMSGYRIVFGATSTNMTNIAVAAGGANATNWFHFGTNTFTSGIASNTFTNSAAFVLPDGTRLDGIEDLGSPSAVTNGGATINGSPITNGANITVSGSTDTNIVNGLINASSNMSARLASNVWAAADSTTNFVKRTGGSYYTPSGWLFANQPGDTFVSIGADSNITIAVDAAHFLLFNSTGFNLFNVPFSGDGSGLTSIGISQLNNGSGILTNGGPVATNYMPRTGGEMSGALTNRSSGGFVGNGAGLTNLPPVSVAASNNYIDVKAPPYNAPGGGANSTAAFLSAFTNPGPCTIFIPGDTYTLTSSVRVLPYQTVLFGGAVISNAAATQGVFFANGATGFTMFGSAYLRGTGGGVGLLISNSVAWKISGLDIRRFAEGIHVSGTNPVAIRGSGGQASGLYVAECGLGANFEAGSSAEYNTFVGCKFVNCWTGMYLAAGNINLDACTISENTNGLRVTGGGYNSVHPTITGLQHAHNGTASAWGMLIENVTNGVFFNGGMLADTSANMIITNSINVSVRNATVISQSIKSYNSTVVISDNMMTDGGSSVTAAGGQMMVYGNSGTNGQWVGNQPAPCYVSAFRGNNTNQTISTNHTILICNVVSNDLLGAYSTNTGIFTAPWAGVLTVNASTYISATSLSTNNYLEINQNSDLGGNNPWGVLVRYGSGEAMGVLQARMWVNKGDTVGVGISMSGATNPVFYGALNKNAVQFIMGAP